LTGAIARSHSLLQAAREILRDFVRAKRQEKFDSASRHGTAVMR
jgi:hypothetical protein